MKKTLVLGIRPELKRLFKKLNATSTGDKLYTVNCLIRQILLSNYPADIIFTDDYYVADEDYISFKQYLLTVLSNRKYKPWKVHIASIRNNRMVLEYEE